jgi:hypothetical protein
MMRAVLRGAVCLRLWLVVAPFLALTLAGCASWLPAESTTLPSDAAGEWTGSMDGWLGRAAANLIVQPTGRYEGTLHLRDGDRPFSGTIMTLGSRGGRYAGTDGDGTVTFRQEGGRAVLKFVRDGGGSTATFTRLP